MSVTVTEADRERLAAAVEFYIARCTWASGDEEKAEFERVLADLNGRSPRNDLVEALRDGGMEADWAETVADYFFEYARPADRLTGYVLTDTGRAGLLGHMVKDDISPDWAAQLVERLDLALKQNASTKTPDLRRALLELLAETGSAAGWNEFIVDRWIAYTGDGRRAMTPDVQAAFTEYIVERDQDRTSSVWLIGLLAEALEQNAAAGR